MKDVFAAIIPTSTTSSARHAPACDDAASRGAFHGVPGARAFRRHFSEHGVKPGAGVSVLRDAMALVEARAAALVAA